MPIYYAGAPCVVLNIERMGRICAFLRASHSRLARGAAPFALGGGMHVDHGIQAPDAVEQEHE